MNCVAEAGALLLKESSLLSGQATGNGNDRSGICSVKIESDRRVLEARRQAESSRISFTGGPCRCGEGGKCLGNPLCFYILYFFSTFHRLFIFLKCLFMSLFYSTHLFSQLRRPTRERSPSSVPIRKHSSRSQSYAAMTPEFVNSQHSRNKIVFCGFCA